LWVAVDIRYREGISFFQNCSVLAVVLGKRICTERLGSVCDSPIVMQHANEGPCGAGRWEAQFLLQDEQNSDWSGYNGA